MDSTYFLIAAIGLLLGITLVLLLRKNSPAPSDDLRPFLAELRKENAEAMHHLRQELSTQLSEARKLQFASGQELNKRLDRSAEVIGAVQKNLGQVSEATKQIFEVGKNISSLQDILRSPKLRGNFGEILLENLLEQMLPGRYEMQFTFKTGERADAILKLKEGKIVAIDSKFPLEDFLRLANSKDEEESTKLRKALVAQTKKHVDAVAKKYILPAENTLDFAFLYVPAENVYYELTTSDENILDYAWKKKIFLVSPNSFYAYLVTVLQGMRALQIEENVQKILMNIARLHVDFQKFEEDFAKLGGHLRHATGSFEASEKRFGKLNTDLEKALGDDSSAPRSIT